MNTVQVGQVWLFTFRDRSTCPYLVIDIKHIKGLGRQGDWVTTEVSLICLEFPTYKHSIHKHTPDNLLANDRWKLM
jgi:hypothetical protein